METNDILARDVYYNYVANPLEMPVTPLVVGLERCRKNKGKIKSNKTCYVLHYVLSGEGEVTVDGKTHTVSAHDFFLFMPHSNAVYMPNRSNPWSYIWIEFNGPGVRDILSMTSFLDGERFAADSEDLSLKKLFESMVREDNQASESAEPVLITGYIFRILSFLIQNHPKKETVNFSKEEAAVKEVEGYLDAHYADWNLSMAEVASIFSFSQSYLTRLFKSQTGITPIQYVNELRMKKAIELLNCRSLSVNQIAEAIGYKNQFYFTKRFKKYYGVPPSKYKQKNIVDF